MDMCKCEYTVTDVPEEFLFAFHYPVLFLVDRKISLVNLRQDRLEGLGLCGALPGHDF
jgi:hypothetical protein